MATVFEDSEHGVTGQQTTQMLKDPVPVCPDTIADSANPERSHHLSASVLGPCPSAQGQLRTYLGRVVSRPLTGPHPHRSRRWSAVRPLYAIAAVGARKIVEVYLLSFNRKEPRSHPPIFFPVLSSEISCTAQRDLSHLLFRRALPDSLQPETVRCLFLSRACRGDPQRRCVQTHRVRPSSSP